MMTRIHEKIPFGNKDRRARPYGPDAEGYHVMCDSELFLYQCEWDIGMNMEQAIKYPKHQSIESAKYSIPDPGMS